MSEVSICERLRNMGPYPCQAAEMAADIIDALTADMELIMARDTYWARREDLTQNSVIVQDDGTHYNVRILGPYGRIACAALARARGEQP